MIYNEDCLEGMKKLADGSVDMIATDPPYFTGMTHTTHSKPCLSDLNICRPFYRQVFQEINRVLTDKGCLYWFCDWRSMGFYLAIMELERVPVKNCLVWDKGDGPGNFYTSNHELILFATFNNKWVCKGAVNIIRGFKRAKKGLERLQPSQKPIELIAKLIKDSTAEGGTVLDPFMGSGTTAIACLNLNRNFIGFEIDELYFEIAQKRIDEALAKKAQELF